MIEDAVMEAETVSEGEAWRLPRPTVDHQAETTAVAAGQLRAVVERVERLEEEKREIAEQIKEVFAEAKANGFDTKTIRRVIALRKKNADERSEEEAMLDLYLDALGMASS